MAGSHPYFRYGYEGDRAAVTWDAGPGGVPTPHGSGSRAATTRGLGGCSGCGADDVGGQYWGNLSDWPAVIAAGPEWLDPAHGGPLPVGQDEGFPGFEEKPKSGILKLYEQPFWRIAGYLSAGACAYHGYKRNQSIGWAIGWAIVGGIAPIIAPAIAVAQGFGKRKSKKNPSALRRATKRRYQGKKVRAAKRRRYRQRPAATYRMRRK